MIEAFDVAYRRATSRIVCASIPVIGATFSGRVLGDVLLERFVVLGAVADELLVDEPFLDDDVEHAR